MTHDRRRDLTLLYGGGTDDGELLTETWAWNGRRWDGSPMRAPRRAHFGFVDDAEGHRPLIHGGYDGSAAFGDLWSWDGAAWTEQDVDDGPGPDPITGSPRAMATCCCSAARRQRRPSRRSRMTPGG